ncbi:CaiB/BaiF CoA transferase family protein [Sphingomonas crocodyli]|uniref:CoA transferase n=1 Tax=Sphingomonas crocodyli TaxID=1979270 RepID=A0A437LWL1_9SPHN|nr:CaiB/BaiF CoA-transferase family protein [Sphingomonas crocodyli]RVT89763.1 CoA transferase [Sphingomonas crocodyli]
MAYDMLAGVKVVELAMYAFAPSCAAVLADWGAEVVKIMPPSGGDPMANPKGIAGLPDKDVGISFMWEQLNRGKRCIVLDVATPEGRDILFRMLEEADVFITHLLPNARRRLGIDVDDLTARFPKLIYARASGHGAKGPEAPLGGFDHTDFWARSGMAHAASLASDEFVPQPGPALGDSTSGMFMAGGIAAALFRRERTGKGGVVDVSLLSSAAWAFAPGIVASKLFDVDTIPRLRHADQPAATVAAYRTRDGREIYFAGVPSDKVFAELATAFGAPELASDPRFADLASRKANARASIEIFDAMFAKHDLAEWKEKLKGVSIPWAVIQTAREASEDVQVLANGYVMHVEGQAGDYALVASPAQFDGAAPSVMRAPTIGEHSDAVLRELGLDDARIAALREGGVVA